MTVLCFYSGEELTAQQLSAAEEEQRSEIEWGIDLIKATHAANHGTKDVDFLTISDLLDSLND